MGTFVQAFNVIQKREQYFIGSKRRPSRPGADPGRPPTGNQRYPLRRTGTPHGTGAAAGGRWLARFPAADVTEKWRGSGGFTPRTLGKRDRAENYFRRSPMKPARPRRSTQAGPGNG